MYILASFSIINWKLSEVVAGNEFLRTHTQTILYFCNLIKTLNWILLKAHGPHNKLYCSQYKYGPLYYNVDWKCTNKTKELQKAWNAILFGWVFFEIFYLMFLCKWHYFGKMFDLDCIFFYFNRIYFLQALLESIKQHKTYFI